MWDRSVKVHFDAPILKQKRLGDFRKRNFLPHKFRVGAALATAKNAPRGDRKVRLLYF